MLNAASCDEDELSELFSGGVVLSLDCKLVSLEADERSGLGTTSAADGSISYGKYHYVVGDRFEVCNELTKDT